MLLKNILVWTGFILLCLESMGQDLNDSKSGSDIIVENASIKLISKRFSFTEGPATDKRGNVFFTDQPNNKIWKYTSEGILSVFLNQAGRSNGMYFDKKGNLITCADEKSQLWSVSPEGKVSVLLRDFKGKKLNGPNDLWIDSKGGIYFTDPYYQRDYWTRKTPELEKQNVYYLPKGKRQAIVVADDLQKPNGIIGTPDGKYLYVADIEANKTYQFKIDTNGTLVDKKLFVTQGSDGMTIDNLGNIYLTGNGITVYNKKGKKIQYIDVPEPWTANVSFGGKHKNLLFITASKAIYTLEMKVKGVQ